MKILRLFIKTHRILGICLSILFLMWFVSGIVMMYHTYPRVEKEQALAFAEDIDTVLLPIQNLVEELPLRDPVKSISLNKRAGENVIRISTEEEEFLLNARTGLPIGKFSSGQLQQIANRWSSGDAMLKDTLNEIDVWLIGAYPFKDFPVYHYCFPDEEKGELYLSSRTGDALQFTTWKSRFWAWVGAIPHWIYVKQFRAHGRQPWKDIVLWVSGIGILMTLSGIYVGIRSFRIARKKHHTGTPYRKRLFRYLAIDLVADVADDTRTDRDHRIKSHIHRPDLQESRHDQENTQYDQREGTAFRLDHVGHEPKKVVFQQFRSRFPGFERERGERPIRIGIGFVTDFKQDIQNRDD